MIELEIAGGAKPTTLICVFRGWSDSAQAASLAMEYLRDGSQSHKVGEIDPEEFYDFQVARPTVHLVDGMTRDIRWPQNQFLVAKIDGLDVLLFDGIEPNLRWRTFCSEIISSAQRVGIDRLITLGAFYVDVPHSRIPAVIGTSSDPDLSEELGLIRSQYEGPTGIVGVLQHAAGQAGMTSISFWTGAPHYLASVPNPRIALALLEKLSEFIGISPDTTSLQDAVGVWETQVAEIVSANEELSAYVARLEELYADVVTDMRIPSGEELSRQLEEFQRNTFRND